MCFICISVYYVAVRTIVLSRHGSNLERPVIIHVIIHGLIYVPSTPCCGFFWGLAGWELRLRPLRFFYVQLKVSQQMINISLRQWEVVLNVSIYRMSWIDLSDTLLLFRNILLINVAERLVTRVGLFINNIKKIVNILSIKLWLGGCKLQLRRSIL